MGILRLWYVNIVMHMHIEKGEQIAVVSLQVGKESSKVVGTELDTIQLSIFSHRFMSTAEQMGR